jgi:hypothetical protein
MQGYIGIPKRAGSSGRFAPDIAATPLGKPLNKTVLIG